MVDTDHVQPVNARDGFTLRATSNRNRTWGAPCVAQQIVCSATNYCAIMHGVSVHRRWATADWLESDLALRAFRNVGARRGLSRWDAELPLTSVGRATSPLACQIHTL